MQLESLLITQASTSMREDSFFTVYMAPYRYSYTSDSIVRLLLLLGPLGRLVFAGIFELVALLLRLVHGRLCVLGRSVDGEKAKRRGTGVDDCL